MQSAESVYNCQHRRSEVSPNHMINNQKQSFASQISNNISSTLQQSIIRKTLDDYEFINDSKQTSAVLGKGTYGTVRLAIDRSNGKKYAIKIMQKASIFQFCTVENLKREIKIQKRMNHPHICKLHQYFEDKQNVYLVLEYAEQGSLFSNLRNARRFPEEIAFRFFYQTCLGIDHLHKNNIIHRDLKPENLLVDAKGDVKLCDFGWSAEGNIAASQSSSFCGTVDYMPPEVILQLPHDHRVDIWCLGVLLYELIHGYAPFNGPDDATKLRNIRIGQEIYFESFVDQDLQDLIRKILQKHVFQRATMNEIFNHPWMMKFYKKFDINIKAILELQKQHIYVLPSHTKPIIQPYPSSTVSSQLSQSQSFTTQNKYYNNYVPHSTSYREQQQQHIQQEQQQQLSHTISHPFFLSQKYRQPQQQEQMQLNSQSSSTNNLYNSLKAQVIAKNPTQRFQSTVDLNFNHHHNNSDRQYLKRLPTELLDPNDDMYTKFDSKYMIQSATNIGSVRTRSTKAEDEEYCFDEDNYFERVKRSSKAINDRTSILKKPKADESMIDRLLIAFGCVSRDKK